MKRIVHARRPRPKREPKPQPVAVVVHAPKRKRQRYDPAEDQTEVPEAVKAFFRKMIRPAD